MTSNHSSSSSVYSGSHSPHSLIASSLLSSLASAQARLHSEQRESPGHLSEEHL